MKRRDLIIFLIVTVLCVKYCWALKYDDLAQAGDHEVDQNDLACAACVALIDVVHKAMKQPGARANVESTVFEVMDDICNEKNYPSYDLPAPTMKQSCLKFIDEHDDMEISKIVTEQYKEKKLTKDLVERAVCLKHAPVCIGSSRMKSNTKVRKSSEPQEDLTEEAVQDLINKHKNRLKTPDPVKKRDEL